MNEPVNNIRPDDGEVDLLDYLIILGKHSRMIIIVSAAVTVLTYCYLFCAPDIYKATARMLPPQQNLTLSAQLVDGMGSRVSPGSDSAGGMMGGMTARVLGLKSPDVIYVAMMTSDTVLDHVIDRFHLVKPSESHESARNMLRPKVNIAGGRKDGIIVIEVTNSIPKMAADMANALIEELDGLLQRLALQEAKGRLAFLEKERLQTSQNLIKAEESLRLFSEQNSVLHLDTQTRGAIQYIAQLRAEIDAKEVGIEVLRQQATPNNFDLIRMETEVKGLKEKLIGAEAQRNNCVSDVCLPTQKAPSLSLEYLRLFREAKFQESLYQLFTRLVEIARLDMVRNFAVVQVLDSAIPPERRSNTRLLPSMLAGIVTFFMMTVVVFGREYMQNVINSEDNVQRFSMLKDYLRPWTDMLKKIKTIVNVRHKN